MLEVPRGNVARRDASRYVETVRDERIDRITRVLEGEPDDPGAARKNADRDDHPPG